MIERVIEPTCAHPDCGQPLSAHAPGTLWCPLVHTVGQRFLAKKDGAA